MSDLELEINRRNTVRFIAAKLSMIALIPVVKSRTPSGGSTTVDGPPRTAQPLRLIELTSPSGNSPGRIRTQDGGQQLKVVYQLLGAHDAVMAVGDHWEQDDAVYEIKDLLPYNGYERRAEVMRRG